MRKLIAGMKITLDGRYEGPESIADWVEAWSDDYGITGAVDACLLGGGMYPGYERYWTSIHDDPKTPAWITGAPPTKAEVEYARFASRTPHYVLSKTLSEAAWPNTRFLRSPDEVAALKRQPGKDIYLVGGAQTLSTLIDAGLVDELRLIVYPLIAAGGATLFASLHQRRRLSQKAVRALSYGRSLLTYQIL